MILYVCISSHKLEIKKRYLTGLFSYEKSSNFLGGGSTLERSHSDIPLPARRIVGIHPVKIVLQKNDYQEKINQTYIFIKATKHGIMHRESLVIDHPIFVRMLEKLSSKVKRYEKFVKHRTQDI